ncbi:hypothetical protein EJK51_1287 [Moraxella catarrhalis]|uniref:Uncharacterized protein n=1 Tax=Moraxella catarrhalis TaxID=480 RepID=A0A3S9QCD8_MORCA|nr:hypothetical protein MCR_1239 [Moraxella catarrhalis BBH18]AZQ87299.1 hypothetical protein EJK52_1288 [Moraxella catarrhalis]EKF83200.1 hypothetical protein MCRH_1309 [Moraxella catarrhalis RH4]AZQ90302.1 hypothetical protein EJK50_1351 [Moraxella catarrhalis]AZQ90905.1 hypothetical protein EJK51_1287 [Moraxella catarrhalis]
MPLILYSLILYNATFDKITANTMKTCYNTMCYHIMILINKLHLTFLIPRLTLCFHPFGKL